MSAPHRSVLLQEVLKAFEGVPLHVFVDATLGAAGHAQAILEMHPEIDCFVGIDQDPTALEIARSRLALWKSVRLFHANFSELPSILSATEVNACDGILMDLGVSSMQLDTAERGFSINRPGPLDMRMNPGLTLTAEDIVNTASEEELGRIFRDFGEEKRWRPAAKAIVQTRKGQPLKTTQDLVDLLLPLLRNPRSSKGIHPLTLIFQALRIAVNDELGVLERTLKEAVEALAPGGRLAVISFHSLEDRMAKRYFSYLASDKESTRGIAGVFLDKKPTIKLLTNKPILPSEQESVENPRARSAKLRVVEKLPS